MVVTSVSPQHSRRRPFLITVAALALMVWGAAAFLFASSASPANAAGNGPSAHDHDVYLAVPGADGQWSYVRIDMFVYDDGRGISQAELDGYAAEMASRFPGAVQLSQGAFSAAYVTSGFKWASGQATWAYNGAGAPAGVAGTALMAIQASANAWGQTGASFKFMGGGTSAASPGACSGGGTDGQNVVGWAPQGAGSVLAVTCSWFGGSAGGGFSAAAEFDMAIDPKWSWSTGSPINIDLQSVVTHEFGHALGLNHSGDSSAVMYFSYPAGTNKRMLTGDDIAGEQAIYPAAGGGSTPTNTPTPTRTPTQAPTNTPTPTRTPSQVPTQSPTSQPTSVPTSNPTSSPTTPPTLPPTQTPTQPPTSIPTSTPTAVPTQGGGGATSTPTQAPTNTPTQAPTSPPTVSATATRTPPAPSLPIAPGSNLLSWPGQALPPAVALAGQGANIRMVYYWDPATGTWQRFGPSLPSFLNNLPFMRPGSAYWFIATGSSKLTFEP
ncbi:MAG: matrixin family metalloprotease [Dehalococcoidia bacterium]|nr:matrixin family metalloprotease [Dehalococcoidia bacterium]